MTNPQLLLPSLIFPLFFFVAFAGGLSNIGNVPGFDFPSGYTAFQFVFVLLQATRVRRRVHRLRDREPTSRTASRGGCCSAAPNRLGILAGYALAALMRARSSGRAAVRGRAGHRACGSPATASTCSGCSCSRRSSTSPRRSGRRGSRCASRTIQAGPLMQMPVFIVLFLAPVYVPLALLGGWVHAVAQVNPFTPLIEGGRDLISGGTVDAGLIYGISIALALAFLASGRSAGCGAPSAPDSRCRRLRREARAPPQRPGPVRDRRGGNGACPDARRRRSSRIAVVRAAPRDRSYSSKGAVNGCMCSPASAAPCIENSGRPRLRLSHATQGYRPVDHG